MRPLTEEHSGLSPLTHPFFYGRCICKWYKMKDSSFLSQALSSGLPPNALLAEQPELGAGHPPTRARIGLAQPPSQSGVDTLELSKLVGEGLLVGEVLSSPKVLLGGLLSGEERQRGRSQVDEGKKQCLSPPPWAWPGWRCCFVPSVASPALLRPPFGAGPPPTARSPSPRPCPLGSPGVHT